MVSHFHKACHEHEHEHAPATSGRTIRWAFAYDFVVRLLSLNRETALREETIRLAQIDPGAAVLDVGCGTGTLTLRAKAAAGSTGRVCGIDAATEMIAQARKKAQKAGAQVEFQVGVIEALEYADGTFDRVLSSLMMHHLPPDLQKRALLEVYRVLKPGGQLLIVDFDASVPRSGTDALHPNPKTTTPSTTSAVQEGAPGLQQLVMGAGFANVQSGSLQTLSVAFVRGTRP
ncbi:MAG: class I SAM-dependent methyltransferase [Caldilineaceae bacterium]